MPTLVVPSAEVAVRDLPPHILTLAYKHIQGFLGDSTGQDEDVHDWEQVTFAPQARYLHDPAYQNGAMPAYVELRVMGPDGPLDARGYILISLTEEDFPVTEFATRGETKTDRVVQATEDGAIHKFMRFTPAYIAGEDSEGNRLGALGTVPLTFVGQLSPASQPQVRSFDSEIGKRVTPPQSVLKAAPAASYQALKSDFQRNPLRRQFRTSRGKQTAAAWRRSNGIRNPTIRLQVAETQDFLIDKPLVSASVEAAGAEEVVRIDVLPTGGFRATGLGAGSVAVRVKEQTESVDEYIISVTNGQPTIATLSGETKTTASRSWYAGSGWDGDQRQYRQLKRDRWCPLVGCGPVALAMLFGWWDANGVPSVFYRLNSGKGDAQNFRFNYQSLRDSDAPKDASNEEIMVPLYDDLYGLSNVLCNPFGDEGATVPDQMVGAFEEYVSRIAEALPSPQDQYGEKFVGASWKYSYILPGLGTDWEGGGTMVANGIKAGRPGIVGIGSTAFDAHYPLAYGYKRIEHYEGSELVEVDRYFKCNMGWGSGHYPEFHNAENVWFGLTAHFWQKAGPMSPNDIIAAAFAAPHRADVLARGTNQTIIRTSSPNAERAEWSAPWNELPNGVFRSGPAACASADGRSLHIFGRGTDNRIWRAHSPDGGASWEIAWAPVGDGTFTSGPAACVSADGRSLHVFGRGTDNRIWRAYSSNGGASWDLAWAPIGPGTFTSGPAACVSADGRSLHVFGRGNDNRIWRAHSSDGGASWNLAWAAIPDGVFSSGPAAALSADGLSLHVFGRGADNRIWRAHSSDGGANWDLAWAPIGNGVFTSGPAAAISPNGRVIHVFGVGKDRRVWRALSLDGGGSWPIAWAPIGNGMAF